MRIRLLTPTQERCGIASYSRALLAASRAAGSDLELEVRDPETSPTDPVPGVAAGPDIVHLQWSPAYSTEKVMELVAREPGPPRIVTIHDRRGVEPALDRGLADRVAAWIVHSRSHADLLRRYARPERVLYFPHPVPPLEPFAQGDPDRLARYGLRAGAPMVSIFGFVKPYKGYELALRALRKLPPEVQLAIVGGAQTERDESFVEELRDQSARLGIGDRVRITGYVDSADLVSLLGASTVVLAPYQSPEVSGAVATALACGRPVLAAMSADTLDLEAQSSALAVFEPGDSDHLAQRLQSLLGSPETLEFLSRQARWFAASASFEGFWRWSLEAYRVTLAADRSTRPRRARAERIQVRGRDAGAWAGLPAILDRLGLAFELEDSGSAARGCGIDVFAGPLTGRAPRPPETSPAAQPAGPRPERIAYWLAPSLPKPGAGPRILQALAGYDEIWLPTPPCFAYLDARPGAVFEIPPALFGPAPDPAERGRARATLGLRPGEFAFASWAGEVESAALRAFEAGFSEDRRLQACLVLACPEELRPALQTRIARGRLQGNPRARVILAPPVGSPLGLGPILAGCDALASLEGEAPFDPRAAQAMAHALPVVQLEWPAKSGQFGVEASLLSLSRRRDEPSDAEIRIVADTDNAANLLGFLEWSRGREPSPADRGAELAAAQLSLDRAVAAVGERLRLRGWLG